MTTVKRDSERSPRTGVVTIIDVARHAVLDHLAGTEALLRGFLA